MRIVCDKAVVLMCEMMVCRNVVPASGQVYPCRPAIMRRSVRLLIRIYQGASLNDIGAQAFRLPAHMAVAAS